MVKSAEEQAQEFVKQLRQKKYEGQNLLQVYYNHVYIPSYTLFGYDKLVLKRLNRSEFSTFKNLFEGTGPSKLNRQQKIACLRNFECCDPPEMQNTGSLLKSNKPQSGLVKSLCSSLLQLLQILPRNQFQDKLIPKKSYKKSIKIAQQYSKTKAQNKKQHNYNNTIPYVHPNLQINQVSQGLQISVQPSKQFSSSVLPQHQYDSQTGYTRNKQQQDYGIQQDQEAESLINPS